jgi:hypothetical protein
MPKMGSFALEAVPDRAEKAVTLCRNPDERRSLT